MNLLLIGMMGCGKSTCARILQRRLGLPVLDTDERIEKQTGLSVSEIFAQYGEEKFRQLETELCRTLTRSSSCIIACGGGLPLREENRRCLRESGTVFFLNRDPGQIYDSENLSDRPLGQDGREAFLQRFSAREPLYRAAAHYVIDDFSSPEQTAAQIVKLWEGTA